MSKPAFSDELRERLEHGKYTRWAKNLTEDEIEGLLWMIGEYGLRKDRINRMEILSKIPVRCVPDARIKCALVNIMGFVRNNRFDGDGAIERIREAKRDFEETHYNLQPKAQPE